MSEDMIPPWQAHAPEKSGDEQPTSGLSRISHSPPNLEPVRPGRIARNRQPGTASQRHLPKTAFGSIEYPGPVSHASAILDLASQEDIDGCFNVPAKENPLLELHLRRDKMGVPIKGYRVPSQKLLVKVVKRKKRDGTGGVFTAEVVGPITQTVRYRSMGDYHYTPNPDGQTQQLLATLTNLDYDAILGYKMDDLKEEFTIPASPEPGKAPDPELSHRSLLDLQPLPLYSQRRLPLVYNFKLSQATALTDYQDPYTDQIKQRYHNTARYVGFAPIQIGHSRPLGDVPQEPETKVKTKMPKLNQDLLSRMQKERPVWMRHSLLAQFDEAEIKVIVESKAYIPACAYMFGAGPYWKCYARLGFDPRQDPANRIYQRAYFYINVSRAKQPMFATPEPGEEEDNDQPIVPSDRTSHEAWAAEQEGLIQAGLRPPRDPKRAHIFDGQILHRDKPDYQLCDIEDPLIKRYIDDPRLITDTCDPRTGFYTSNGYLNIRDMIKTKYVHVKETNQPAPDSLCYDLMQAIEDGVVRDREAASLAQNVDVEMA